MVRIPASRIPTCGSCNEKKGSFGAMEVDGLEENEIPRYQNTNTIRTGPYCMAKNVITICYR